jgi:hypothetical protein
MVQFFYQAGWKRFILISSEGRDYVSTGEDIKDSIGKQSGTDYKLVRHYEVKRNIREQDIIDNFRSIQHEGRGQYSVFMIYFVKRHRHMLFSCLPNVL